MGGKARKKRHGCCCGCLTAALVIVVCSAIIPSISAMRSNHTIEKLNALSMEMPDGGEAEFVTEGDKVELRMPKEFGKMYYTKSDAEHYTAVGNGEAFVDNEILVVANKGVSAETIAETAERIRAEIVGEITITGDYQLRLQEPRSYDELNALCQELCEDPAIADAYPDWLNPDESDDVSAYQSGAGNFVYGSLAADSAANSVDDNDYPVYDMKGIAWDKELINCYRAWEFIKNVPVSPVRVGLVDECFENHESLQFAGIYQSDDALKDAEGHGMHVAGIMAGLAGVSGDQTSGLTGVYPYGSKGFLYGYSPQEDPRIKPENNPDDWHGYCSNMAYLMSVATLVVQNVKVINISRGLNWNCDPKDDPDGFNRITERLKNQGILDPPETQPEAMLKMFDDYDNFTPWVDQAQKVGAFYQRLLDAGYDFLLVVSAGNLGGYNGEQGDGVKKLAYPRPEPLPLESRYNSTMTMIDSNRYPDVYQRILVVGAVEPRPDMPEEDGVVPMLSGYSNAGDRVDLFAPGGQFLTPDLIRGGMKKFPDAAEGTMIYSTLLENRYGYKAGTSMAAPQASGTAALVWSVNPKLSGADVKEILKQSARRDCIYSNNVNGSDGKIGEIIHDEHYKLLDAEGAVRIAMEFKGSGTAAKQNYGAFVGQVEWKTTEKKWFKTQEKTEHKEGAEIVAVVREGDDIGRTYTATTGVGGSFCLLVPPGTYSIRYGFKDGRKYKGKETNRQTIRAGETIDLNVLTVTDQDESLNIIACNMQLPGTGTAKEEYEIHTDHITEFMKAVGIYVPPKAWMRYYDHIYAIYDYPASGNTKWWGVLWRRNPYPVSIETSGEQKAIEQLMLHGEKVSYITGGQIMFLFENPELYWAISDDDTGFTNFAEGHGIIKEPMLGNFVNLFHGTGKDDPEFGQWKVNHETIRTFLPNYYPEDTGYILEWDCEPLYNQLFPG